LHIEEIKRKDVFSSILNETLLDHFFSLVSALVVPLAPAAGLVPVVGLAPVVALVPAVAAALTAVWVVVLDTA
jgi:hypothetical protein